MERFKPKPQGWSARILASSVFYMFLVCVIAVATIFLIYTELKIHHATQAEQIASSQEQMLRQPVAGLAVSTASSTSPASTRTEAQNAPVVATTSTTSTTSTLVQAVVLRPISRVRLYYLEGLVEYFPGSSGYTERDNILNDRNQPLDSKARVLNEVVLTDFSNNHEAIDNQMTEDPRLDRNAHGIGITTRLGNHGRDEKSSKLDVNLTIRYPDTVAPDRTVQIRTNTLPQFEVEMVTSRVFYIGNLLPHRLYSDSEDVLKELAGANPVLRIMLSPTFSSQRFTTDFILLIAANSDANSD